MALARLFRKGANFTAAMAFEIASTNLVIELGIILALLMGWQFTAGRVRRRADHDRRPGACCSGSFLRPRLSTPPRAGRARRRGSMEGHAAMDMSVTADRSLSPRDVADAASPSVSQSSSWSGPRSCATSSIGLLIAGAIAAWVPESFWQSFFLDRPPAAREDLGAARRPASSSMLTFVCSIGNVPLAAVLWNGGISFGGVIAFIFADLIILPILDIYRKYYGAADERCSCSARSTSPWSRPATSSRSSSASRARSRPSADAKVVEAGITWNYTTFLNIAFLVLAAVLVIRAVRTGVVPMLRTMNEVPDEPTELVRSNDW